jgi:hypothetical protein
MIGYLFTSTRVRVAAASCVLALLILGWSANSLRAHVRATARATSGAVPTVPALRRADTTSDDLIADAVDRDPFSPARERPARAYGAPAAAVVLNPAAAAPMIATTPRLIGTVIAPATGSFVICQLGEGAPQVLHVGQHVGTYVLRSITQGAATFVRENGERLELRVPRNGS